MKTGDLSSLGVGCCLLAACGSQASPDYVGESLLTLSGSVEIADSQVEGPLRPVLAFRSHRPEGDELHFIEGETTGAFPSDFTLRVTEPPPKVVIDRARMLHKFSPDRFLPFPVAYMTAVGDDLPSAIDAEPSQGGGHDCNGDPDVPCEVFSEWCLNGYHEDIEDGVCYSEKSECAPGTLWRDDCTVVSSDGNPDIRDYPWKRLAGMSEGLVIIWLAKPLAADDPLAVTFELPQLDAGYHAFEAIAPSDEDRAAQEQCNQDALELSIAQYNEEHGGEWTLMDFVRCTADFWPHDRCISGDLSELYQGIGPTLSSNLEQLGCVRELENEHRLLSADETEHISVRIAPDVRPVSERGSW